jgi:hypothetical protein
MSCYQVSPAHIATILTAWAGLGAYSPKGIGFDPTNADTWGPTFDRLATANAASVGARYSETCEAVPRPARLLTVAPVPAIAAIKLIDCLIYQSDCAPEWAGSEVERTLQQVKGALVAKLPGYGAAEWSI